MTPSARNLFAHQLSRALGLAIGAAVTACSPSAAVLPPSAAPEQGVAAAPPPAWVSPQSARRPHHAAAPQRVPVQTVPVQTVSAQPPAAERSQPAAPIDAASFETTAPTGDSLAQARRPLPSPEFMAAVPPAPTASSTASPQPGAVEEASDQAPPPALPAEGADADSTDDANEPVAAINAAGQPEVYDPAQEAQQTPQEAPPLGNSEEELEDRDVAALSDFDPYLQDYGSWVDHPYYGTVWVPARHTVGTRFVPYVTSGHWALTTTGDWIWVSDLPFGWVVFHYGRWVWTSDYGWVWIAGRRYANAWVEFRTFPGPYGYVGWGPLPPRYIWRAGFAVSIGRYYPVPYVFCPWDYAFYPSVSSYIIWDRYRVRGLVHRSRPYRPRRHNASVTASPPVSKIPVRARPSGRVLPNPNAIAMARPKAGRQPGDAGLRVPNNAKPAAVQRQNPALGNPSQNRRLRSQPVVSPQPAKQLRPRTSAPAQRPIQRRAVAPNQAVPRRTAPPQGAPAQAAPNQAVPRRPVPAQAAPNQAVPRRPVPNQAVPRKDARADQRRAEQVRAAQQRAAQQRRDAQQRKNPQQRKSQPEDDAQRQREAQRQRDAQRQREAQQQRDQAEQKRKAAAAARKADQERRRSAEKPRRPQPNRVVPERVVPNRSPTRSAPPQRRKR